MRVMCLKMGHVGSSLVTSPKLSRFMERLEQHWLKGLDLFRRFCLSEIEIVLHRLFALNA